MLIKRIETETKQEPKKQARLNEFEKDYKYIIEDRKNQRQSENLENKADRGVRSYLHNIDGTNAENQSNTKRYSFNEKGEVIDVNKRLIK